MKHPHQNLTTEAEMFEMTAEERKAFAIRLANAEIAGLARELRDAELLHAQALVLFVNRKNRADSGQHMTLMHEWSKQNDVLLSDVTKAQDKLDQALTKLDVLIRRAV